MLRLAITALLWLVAGTTLAQPLRGLLLTSPGVYHNYEYQTRALAEGLAQNLKIRFDVSLAESERWKSTDFARGYDVLVDNICMADNRDNALIANLRRQTEVLGIPTVVLHCTMHSFRDTNAWWPLYGLKSYHHDPLGPMRQAQARQHPILTDIPKNWTVASDELYINLAFEADSLLRAQGEDGKTHITTWITTAGNAQVFGTTLGHSNQTIEDPVYQRLVANGIAFVTGNMDAQGNIDEQLKPQGESWDVLEGFSAPQGVKFLGAEGQDCVRRQFAVSVGPCYIGCTLNPLLWGEQADNCRKNCNKKLPTTDQAIKACS